MQAADFNRLSLQSKLQWVYFQGEFLMDIRYYEYKVNLYRIDDFLIEVFYNHKNDRIELVNLLDRTSGRMQFYADQVKLNTRQLLEKTKP